MQPRKEKNRNPGNGVVSRCESTQSVYSNASIGISSTLKEIALIGRKEIAEMEIYAPIATESIGSPVQPDRKGKAKAKAKEKTRTISHRIGTPCLEPPDRRAEVEKAKERAKVKEKEKEKEKVRAKEKVKENKKVKTKEKPRNRPPLRGEPKSPVTTITHQPATAPVEDYTETSRRKRRSGSQNIHQLPLRW